MIHRVFQPSSRRRNRSLIIGGHVAVIHRGFQPLPRAIVVRKPCFMTHDRALRSLCSAGGATAARNSRAPGPKILRRRTSAG